VEAREQGDEQSAVELFNMAVEAIDKAGARLLQQKPFEVEPLPDNSILKDPVTGKIFDPFTIADERARLRECTLLAKADPKLFEHLKARHESPITSALKRREDEAQASRNHVT
jgi:hypothetical protein